MEVAMRKNHNIYRMLNCNNYIIWLVGLLFPSLATIVSRVSIAKMSQDIVSEIESGNSNLKTIIFISLSLLCGAFIAEIAVGIFHYMLQKVRVDSEVKVRENVFIRIIRMKLCGLEQRNRGEMTQRYNNDTAMVASALTVDIENCIFPFVIGIGYCVLIMLKQVYVGLFLLLFIVIIAIQNVYYLKKFQNIEKAILQAKEKYTGKIDMSYSAKMTIRFFELQRLMNEKIEQAGNDVYNTERKRVSLSLKKAFTSDMLIAFCSTLTLPIVCVIAKFGYLSLPEVMFITSLSSSIMGFTGSFSNALIQLKRDAVSKQRIEELLFIEQETYSEQESLVDMKEEEEEHSILGVQSQTIEGEQIEKKYNSEPRISFQNVSIRYGEHLVLNQVSMDIRAGEITALVGNSGSGKSSLLKALVGFNDYEGTIKIHNVDLATMTVDEIRNQITYIADDNELYHTTLVENIKFGNSLATNQEVVTAMNAVGLFEFLDENGVNDIDVGEEGNRLSGGQRQRVAIARGLLKNSKIILLDEPTSAIDVISEQRVMEQLRYLADQGANILMSTHSISAITSADRILMVKDQKLMDSIALDEVIEYLSAGKEISHE